MATMKAESVPGFKSFWENSKRIAACQNLTFVQVEIEDPSESMSPDVTSKILYKIPNSTR